jgi:ribosomal protein L11 methyltransferase
MPWLQIRFTVPRDQAPLLEAVLEGAGALAVTLDDAGDDPLLEPAPGTLPLWRGVRVTGLFEDDPESAKLVQAPGRSAPHPRCNFAGHRAPGGSALGAGLAR